METASSEEAAATVPAAVVSAAEVAAVVEAMAPEKLQEVVAAVATVLAAMAMRPHGSTRRNRSRFS